MGYLAIDSSAVGQLKRALQSALDQLSDLSLTDPEAAGGRNLVRRSVERLVSWYPILDGLSSCAALTNYEHVGDSLKKNDLTVAVWTRLDDAGYQIVRDPMGSGIDDPYLEAQQLAITLRDGNLEKLLSDGELKWLRERLEVLLSTPEGRWAFVDTLGTDGLSKLANALQKRWWDGKTCGDPSVMGDAEATLAAIGAGLALRRNEGGSIQPVDVIDATDPIAASFMAIAMQVTPSEFAALSEHILDNFAANGQWLNFAPVGMLVMPGDILFPKIAASPEASRDLLLRCRDKLDEIFQMSYDKASVQQMIEGAVAWNPDTYAAGVVLVPTLTYLSETDLHWGYDNFDWSFLGKLAAPYSSQFTIAGAEEWPWPGGVDQAKNDVFTFLIGIPGALDPILAQQARQIANLIQTGQPLTAAAFELISALKALINKAVEHNQIDQAIADQAVFRMIMELVGALAGAAGGAVGSVGGPAGEFAGGIAGEKAWSEFQRWMQEAGWLPPTEAMIEAGESRLTDYRAMIATHAIVIQYLVLHHVPVDSWPTPAPGIDDERPDKDRSCPSGAYRSNMTKWLNGSHAGVTPSAAADLRAILDGTLSADGSEYLCYG